MSNKLIIAIDGPGAAGKSTVAKVVAKTLNLTYIDTGAMYRSLALYALQNNIDINSEEELANAIDNISIILDESGKVYLNGKDVSFDIRTRDVTAVVSKVSSPRLVREKLVKKQQELAKISKNGVVMDGRDIGTVVLTNANLKIFQIASADVRARRRHEENLSKGIESSFEEIKAEIERRDYMDTHKAYGPLLKADDAIELDTSDMSIDEVVEFIINKAKELM